MIKTTKSLAAAIAMTAALAFTATTASAEKIANLSSGAWKGGAYTSNATGSFSHCAANARYKSGVALLFSVTHDRQWSMGFFNDHWDLTPGRKYPVRYQVDNGPIMKGIATAKNPKMVQVHLPPKDRMFRHFKIGHTLKVAADNRVMRFKLTGTDRMLSKLYRCASHFARKTGKDPFSSVGFTYD
ncbi:MAG: hypothetical protein AAGF81_08175 [Pseudomonadota bacterium]